MGLLRNFCERHGIRCKRAYGEGDSVDPEAVKKSMEDVIQSIKDDNYSLRDIYNADETGLFFRMSPLKTLATKGELYSMLRNVGIFFLGMERGLTETISNCFFKSGTLEQVDPIKDAENKQEVQDYSTKINRILSKEIEDLTTLIAKFKTTSEKIEAKEYITIDDNTSGKCDEDDNCEDGSDDEKESDDEAVK
jgi:hypothetical protein